VFESLNIKIASAADSEGALSLVVMILIFSMSFSQLQKISEDKKNKARIEALKIYIYCC
jgi:hypothetical protein